MIKYGDGVEARLGDHVDHDGYPGTVEDVIDTNEDRKRWGLEDRGLMIKTEAFGLMFEPVDDVAWDAIILTSRADTQPLEDRRPT